MAEFKHGFERAKMNKDLDERLIPNGEYRDANNVQVSTSDGSNVGVVQNLSGNVKHSTIDHTANGYYGVPDTATCVASIPAQDKDKIYYFVSSSDLNNASGEPAICKDYILEYNTVTEKHKYVFVDIWNVKTKVAGTGGASFNINDDVTNANDSVTINQTGIRVGMYITGGSQNYQEEDNVIVTDISVNSTQWKITTNKVTTFGDNNEIVFRAPRVLKFSKNTLITGVNILDDFIYWTDNISEPKKVNIPRSIAGTGGDQYLFTSLDLTDLTSPASANGGNTIIDTSETSTIFDGDTDYFHTRLVKPTPDGSDNLRVVTNRDGNKAVWVQESHVTVIRPAPTQPLELDMYRVVPEKLTNSGVAVATSTQLSGFNFHETEADVYAAGSPISIPSADGVIPAFSTPVFFQVGEYVLFTLQEGNTEDPGNFADYEVRALVTSSPCTNVNNISAGTIQDPFVFEIVSIAGSGSIHTTDIDWFVRLETPESLFEYKFPRFSYRYKYADGEYSPFAPFSEIAFLPDKYSYEPKEGYNFGMVNQLRSLALRYYHYDADCIPQDLSEIDILYKETNNPVVFVVKTLKRNDVHPVWPDLNDETDNFLRGSFNVTTDMIHAAVPSNQLLRPWDNVPRRALAQEISANRLIYGNYVQNYTVDKDPVIELSLVSDKKQDIPTEYAMPSVKTMRTYQVGVVYSDRYGRETPILTGLNEKGLPNSMTVFKPASPTRNRLNVKLNKLSSVPNWADYMTYYVKETSVEYYNLASDRWYAAEDGNIWLSFPSSERNKLDEETFIELKKAHGTNQAVIEPARFKVLAIENEAPTDIRTARNSLGILIDNDSVGNDVGFGYPVVGSNFITIEENQFSGIFDLELITGSLSLVLGGNGDNRSREYMITSRTLTGNGYMRLELRESFGQDVAFVDGITDLTVQIFELVQENLPEFDGRFFVKIRRNAVLNAYLFQGNGNGAAGGGESLLIPWGSHNLGYLNNNGYTQEALGPVSCVNQPSERRVNENDSVAGLAKHPTERSENWDGQSGQTEYIWGNDGNARGITAEDIEGGNEAINGDGGEGFWKSIRGECMRGSLFIDAATAWSWTSKEYDRPGNLYNIPSSFSTHDWMEWIHWPEPGQDGWGDAWPDREDGAPGGMPGNMKDNKGQPSRGIWGEGRYMDVSWSGMETGADRFGSNFDNDADDNGGSYDHKVSDGSGDEFLAVTDFMVKLTTVGTLFRFRRDPRDLENSLYRVTGFYNVNNYGYASDSYEQDHTSNEDGVWGIRNCLTWNTNKDEKQYQDFVPRQRWTIAVDSVIGGDQQYGYSPILGTNPNLVDGEDDANFRRALCHDFTAIDQPPDRKLDAIEIYEEIDLFSEDRGNYARNPAVWETIPKESVELDIYYQASGLIPLELNNRTNEEYIPIRSKIRYGDNEYTVKSWSKYNQIELEPIAYSVATGEVSSTTGLAAAIPYGEDIKVLKRNNYECVIGVGLLAAASQVYITLHGGLETQMNQDKLHTKKQILDWNNCWVFFNGVESDRIRDDFNAPQMDNGVKVSSGIGRQVKEEHRKHGLIWSGIYNSNSGINDTNQFIMAESITKDLNPVYGSIQTLLNRDTRLIMFCEDKILRAVTNKDALYNADGNPQLVASNAVVGDVQAYKGKFGIATNPESMAQHPFAVYFSDAMRGRVLRLTDEGIVPISDLGMKDYFADLMSENIWRCLGTYDDRKGEYNLTTSKKYTNTQVIATDTSTASYSEGSKGWVSFKSFIPEHGTSINNNYYTFDSGHLWKHHDETSLVYSGYMDDQVEITMSNVVGLEVGMLVEAGEDFIDGTIITEIEGNTVTINNPQEYGFFPNYPGKDVTFSTPKNTFYGTYANSDITVVFNDVKSSVKSFNTIKYEGSQARINEWESKAGNLFTNVYATGGGLVSANLDDKEYYNLDPKNGWYVDSIITDLQSSGNIFFKDKEGKYYGYPTGETTSLSNLDEKEFSVQGLGNATMQHDTSGYKGKVTVQVTNNTSSTYQGDDGSGGAWDSTAVITDETSKWQCTIGSKDVIGGATIGSSDETLTFVLSPIINGVYSGNPVAAENLTWAGGADADSNYVWVDDTTAGGDPDDDDTIYSVGFTNNGVAGDPSNTVTVTVTFKNGDTYPNADVLWYIDIDEKAIADVVVGTTPELRDVAFQVTWPKYSTSNTLNPVNITTPDITETQMSAGAGPYPYPEFNLLVPRRYSFIGHDSIESDVNTLVAEIPFSTQSNNHYGGFPIVSKIQMGEYEDYYTVEIVDEVYTAGLLTGFTVKVYYTAGSVAPVYPDPANNNLFYEGHTIALNFVIKVSNTGGGIIDDTITEVSRPKSIPVYGGAADIKVHGSPGAKYSISIEEKNTGGGTIGAGYYNHSTNSFESKQDNTTFTIPAAGVYNHSVGIGEKNSTLQSSKENVNSRFDVSLKSVGTTSLASNIPRREGDATITQYGYRELNLQVKTFDDSLYGTLPAAVVKYYPADYENSNYKLIRYRPVTAIGGNGGLDKNPIILNSPNKKIKVGMRVIAETYDLDGADTVTPTITHGTTVTKVDGRYIHLSASHTVADNTEITFVKESQVIPFEFRVIENGDGDDLSLTAAVDLSKEIGCGSSVSILTSAGSGGKTITLDNIKGVKVGDTVTSRGVSGVVKVLTLASATTVTVDKNMSLSDNQYVRFSNDNNITLINASKVKIGDNIFIRGHLHVSELADNIVIPILIDNIITSA